MKNLTQSLWMIPAVLGMTLPWACSKSFSVSPTAPAPGLTATATSTPQFSPTATLTPFPSSTPTNSPTPSVTPTSTATFTDINFSSGTTVIPAGIYRVGCVHIGAGASVTIQGAVTLFCTCFTLDAGATITGVGRGYEPQDGKSTFPPYPGQGAGSDEGTGDCGALCTGGGHGGSGGAYSFAATLGGSAVSCYASWGGWANDDAVHPAQMGSAGGWPRAATGMYCYGCGTQVSWGGGLLRIVVYDPVSNTLSPATVNGVIDMSGANGGPEGYNAEYSGGGAGGTVLIEASQLSGSGVLAARGGGAGIPYLGPVIGTDNGGGGGGIISLIANTSAFSGTTSVLNGPNAQPGIVGVTAPPSSGY